MEKIIIFIIFIVIWIVRSIMENGNDPKVAQQKDDRKNRLRDEIEKFKRELSNDRKDDQQEWKQKRRKEVVAEQRGDRGPKRAKPRKERVVEKPKPRRVERQVEANQPKKTRLELKEEKAQSRAPLSQRKEFGDRHLGEGVIAHANEVSSHASNMISSSSKHVSGHVKEHLEPFNTRIAHAKEAADISPEMATFSSNSIADILKNPSDVKKAILINEVLQTPLSRRNSKSI